MVLPECADDAADRAFIGRVRAALRAVADPEKAGPMQAYMKSEMPFLGVAKPERAAALRSLYARWRPEYVATWRSTVLALFRGAEHREERYAALDLLGLKRFRRGLNPDCLELCETLIVEGAWWDIVDPVAGQQVNHMLATWPREILPTVWGWAEHDDRWLRRSAIICQLGRKGDTDRELLTHAIDANLDHPDVFLRKAIGWALRNLGDHDPDWVVELVSQRQDRISRLSRREALRKQWAEGQALELKPGG